MALVQTSSNAGINSRRLQRASQYVQKQWIPLNQDLLHKIKLGLDEGVYELDLSFLIDDLKLDHGLFLSCLRELGKQLKQEMGAVPDISDPIKLMHFSGYERLKQVLKDTRLNQSQHQLTKMTREQSTRIKESVISISAVESMLRERKRDTETGFSIALLRQLGLTLVAWNYPTVYQRALAASESQSVEDGVIDQLGFSPQSLALQVLVDWGICDIIDTDALGNSDAIKTDSEEMQSLRELIHLCEVGETLARACHPDFHPPKVKPWVEAKEVILDVLGESGIRLVQAKVVENARAYIDYFPGHFNDIKNLDPDACRKKLRSAGQVNSHSRYCAEDVKKLLNLVYIDIQEGNDKLAIAKLVKQVIPAAGFYAGAIYIIDPLSDRLVPRVYIQKPRLVEVKQLAVDMLQHGDSPILAAYHCSSPIVENVLDPNIGYVSYAAGVLGTRQRAGVLYLEMEDISFEASSTNSLATFKAIRQAFCDCLKLH